MNWRPRSSTVSGASREAAATELEYMELVNDAGDVVASFAEDVDGNVTMEVDGQPKVYRALLTQMGTDAPVATVQENTLGTDVTWVYSDTGVYDAILTLPVLTAGKTYLPPLNASRAMEATDPFVVTSFYYIDTNQLRVQMALANIAEGTLSLTDGLLANNYVEILVYP